MKMHNIASKLAQPCRHVVEELEQRTLLAAVAWLGTAGDNLWTTPGNWSSNPSLPGPADDVTISIAANPTITLNSGTQSIKSLTCDEALTISGGSLSMTTASQSHAALLLSGGSIAGAGDLTETGTMTWTGGAMSGIGKTIIANTAALSMSGGARDLNRVLQNDGTATWTAGALQMNDGTFNNNNTFTANSAAALQSYGNSGTNAFNNNAAGTFNQQGTGTTSFSVNATAVSFNNSGGTVNVQAGILGMDAGGSHTSDFAVSAGGILRFGGSHNLIVSSDITGAGGLSVTSGTTNDAGIVNLGGTATFSGGTATFSGSSPFTTGGLNIPGGIMRMLAGGNRIVLCKTIAVTAGGLLDLNDNDLIVDYSGASQLAATQALINFARSGGTWTGGGITSTSAKNNPLHNTTLGAIEASDFKSIYGAAALFDGQGIDATAVLVKYTYYGDADFNGTVNFDDYSHTDTGFNLHRSGWLNGDFDGNGHVDFDDYALIDLAFNTQGAPLRHARGGGDSQRLPALR